MSLHPSPIDRISAETMRVAHAAFPCGTVVTRLRNEFANLYCDENFAALYPRRGQPGLAPWRLSRVTVLQFLEHLSDRQAADARTLICLKTLSGVLVLPYITGHVLYAVWRQWRWLILALLCLPLPEFPRRLHFQ